MARKLENDNPADDYNTVLKMAKKRALVDAVLTATAASDIFTQDLEDITANMAMYPQASATELLPASAPLPRTKPAQATTVAPLLEDRDRQEVSAAANQNAPAATARPASLDRWEGSILGREGKLRQEQDHGQTVETMDRVVRASDAAGRTHRRLAPDQMRGIHV